MNKYIESDIKDGFTLLGTGLGHIVAALISGEITEYELKTPLEANVIAIILQSFDNNITIAFTDEKRAALDINDKAVYIYNTVYGCLFRT